VAEGLERAVSVAKNCRVVREDFSDTDSPSIRRRFLAVPRRGASANLLDFMSWLRTRATYFCPLILSVACGPTTQNPSASGGSAGLGGGAALGGGLSTGGVAAGGSASGGQVGTGGGGAALGGSTSGGTDSGGSSGGTGPSLGGGPSGGSGDGAGGGGPESGGSASGGGSGSAVLFSTDFEAETVGKIPATGNASWTTTLPTSYDSAGIVEVKTGSDAHSGANFIYVKKGNDGQSFLSLIDPKVFPFSGSKIHVRAFIKVPVWPDSHVSWMEVGAVKNEESEMRFGAHQGVLQVNHWPGDQDQIAEGVKFDINTWACIEYSYEPGTKTMKVWLNDAPVDALTVTGTFARGGAFDPAPPIAAVRFGTEIQANEAYFDDIAVHTDYIGCD
jgi:hypothetical protein